MRSFSFSRFVTTFTIFLSLATSCADSHFQLKDESQNEPKKGEKTSETLAHRSTQIPVAIPNAIPDAKTAPHPAGISPMEAAFTTTAEKSHGQIPENLTEKTAKKTPGETQKEISDVFDTDLIQFHTDETRWKKISDEDGVTTYQERQPKQDVVAFRGETVIPTSIKRIATVLRDESLRKEWVDALVETRTLEKKSDFEQTEYNHTKVPWPFQDRDFVYRALVKVSRETPVAMLITMSSAEHPSAPEISGAVRGKILHSFHYMKELAGATPQTAMVIEMALDPMGAIPLWMVNLTQKKWPHNTLLSLRKIATRPDLVVPREIEDYFSVSQIKTKGKK